MLSSYINHKLSFHKVKIVPQQSNILQNNIPTTNKIAKIVKLGLQTLNKIGRDYKSRPAGEFGFLAHYMDEF